MSRIRFTPHLQRHVSQVPTAIDAATVRAALEQVFSANPALRGYILDDQGALRHHVAIFINGHQLADRATQSDPVAPTDEIFVMQALSGG